MGYGLLCDECEENCFLQVWKNVMGSAVGKHYPFMPVISVKVLNVLAESSRRENVEDKRTDKCEPQCPAF